MLRAGIADLEVDSPVTLVLHVVENDVLQAARRAVPPTGQLTLHSQGLALVSQIGTLGAQ